MELLQSRFTQVMRDKADLIERCQELEHTNLQLAGETETIGKKKQAIYRHNSVTQVVLGLLTPHLRTKKLAFDFVSALKLCAC